MCAEVGRLSKGPTDLYAIKHKDAVLVVGICMYVCRIRSCFQDRMLAPTPRVNVINHAGSLNAWQRGLVELPIGSSSCTKENWAKTLSHASV